jgi:Ser/Thr protein kinase RdoA (MazF antagonist)
MALRGFFHPAAGHELLWDITHSAKLLDLAGHIENAEDRALALHFINNFEVHASPKLKHLRAQVIHNDFNFHNIIVDSTDSHIIRNILDFGDIVHAPLINDLAVAASYQLGKGMNILAPALDLIAAYHRVCPLEDAEQTILFDLIAARLAVTALITNWRASLYPENSAYILRNAPSAWNALRACKQISRESAQAQIRGICTQEVIS